MRTPALLGAALFVVMPGLPDPASADAASICSPRIATLDTGIDAAHPEFRDGQVIAWKDFVNERAVPYDDRGHGTGVASLVAGATVGTNPGARLVVGKVLDQDGAGEWETIESGLAWALAQAPSVVSLSFGELAPLPGYLYGIDEQFQQAREAGVLIVVSAGNSYVLPSELRSNSFSPHVVIVGAATESGRWSIISNRDPEVIAVGKNVRMAAPGGGYTMRDGTSFSTPQVAGWGSRILEALCVGGWQSNPADRAELLLKAYADDHFYDPYYLEGHGFLNETNVVPAIAQATTSTQQPEATNMLMNEVSDTVRWMWARFLE